NRSGCVLVSSTATSAGANGTANQFRQVVISEKGHTQTDKHIFKITTATISHNDKCLSTRTANEVAALRPRYARWSALVYKPDEKECSGLACSCRLAESESGSQWRCVDLSPPLVLWPNDPKTGNRLSAVRLSVGACVIVCRPHVDYSV